MNELKSELENILLENLNIFSNEELESLKNYHIKTLGGLLNATKGLSLLELFTSFANPEEIIKTLKNIVPEYIIDEYKHPDTNRPTGLILPQNSEKDDE